MAINNRKLTTLILENLAMALLYHAIARIGVGFSSFESTISPIWPASGISIAALTIRGLSLGPGVFLGSAASHLWDGTGFLMALFVGTTATAEATVAATLIHRFVGRSISLKGYREVFGYLLFAGIIGPTVAAALGTFAMHSLGSIDSVAESFVTWLSGDMLGAIIVGPMVIALWHTRSSKPNANWLRLSALIIAIIAITYISFGQSWFDRTYPLTYLPIPILFMAAFIERSLGATLGLFALSITATYFSIHQMGPLFVADMSENERLILLQTYLVTNAIPVLLAGALAEERERAHIGLQSASRAKNQFIANMSHEMRTPLTAITGFSELILEEPEKNQEYARMILRHSHDLGLLVDDTLDHAKVEAGELDIRTSQINLLTLMNEISSIMHPLAKERGITLSIKPHSKNFHFASDPLRLKQILINLLTNAIHHTPSGGKIDLDTEYDRANLFFKVTDTGMGITPELRHKIFEPFTRGSKQGHRRGSGLGLALARKIASQLNGELSLVHSSPQGSRFLLVLSKIENSREHDGSPHQSVSLPKLDGHTIIIAEDVPELQTLFKLYFEHAGAQVILCNNGADVLEQAQKSPHSMVFMDIQMPIMNGYQATQKLRSLGYEKPIVALTAHAMKQEREYCSTIGFTDYLTKPTSRQDLINKAHELL